jgi:hypothetical protein
LSVEAIALMPVGVGTGAAEVLPATLKPTLDKITITVETATPNRILRARLTDSDLRMTTSP